MRPSDPVNRRLVLPVILGALCLSMAVDAAAQERESVRNEVERILQGVEADARTVVAPGVERLARDVEAFEAAYRRYREKLDALVPALELGERMRKIAARPDILVRSSSSFLATFEESVSELRRTLDAVVEHHGALESLTDELCVSEERGESEASVDPAAVAAATNTHVVRRRIALEEFRTALANATSGRREAEELLLTVRTVVALARTTSQVEVRWGEIKAEREALASRREALARSGVEIEEERRAAIDRLNGAVDLIVRHPDHFEDFEHERLQDRIQTARQQLGPVPDVPDRPRTGSASFVLTEDGERSRMMLEEVIERRIRTLSRIGSFEPSDVRELETVSFRLAGAVEETDRLLSSTTLSGADLLASDRRLRECLTRPERIARADPGADPAATPAPGSEAPTADAGDPEAGLPEAGEAPDPGRSETDPGPPRDGDPGGEEAEDPDFGQAPPEADVASDAEDAPSEESEAVGAREDVPLPDVLGLKIDVAARRVSDAGLVPRFQLGSPATSAAQEGTVEDAIPGNTPLRKGDAVILKVRRAPVATGVVPDVEGLYVDEAYTAVEAAGLSPVIVVGEDTRQVDEVNRVYRQAPPGGSTVKEGATVKLTAYVADTPGRVVPRLTGMDVPTARALLDDRELVLETEVVEPAGSLQTANTIARQYPEPGVEVPRGTGVRAYVFDEFEPAPPPTRAPAGEDFGEASPRPIDAPPPAAQREEPAVPREARRPGTRRLAFLDVPTRFLFTRLREASLSGYSTRRVGASTLRIDRPPGGWDGSSIAPLFYEAGREQRGQHLTVTVLWRSVESRPGDRLAGRGDMEHVGPPGEIGVTIGSMMGGGPPYNLIIQVTDPDHFVELEIGTPAGIHRFIDLDRLRSELRTFAREIFDQFDGIAAPR